MGQGSHNPSTLGTAGAPVTPPAGAEPAESEKMVPRAHPRMPMVRTVHVFEIDERGEPGAEAEAQTVDVSRGGLGFMSRRLYMAGRQLVVEIPRVQAGGKLPSFLYGTVKHSRYISGRGHMVGLELAPIPETQTILEWVGQRLRRAA